MIATLPSKWFESPYEKSTFVLASEIHDGARPCSCRCDPGYAWGNGVWECHSGRTWDILDQKPVVHNNALTNDPLLKELKLALYTGELWGDIVLRWEDEEFARLSAADKAASLAAKAAASIAASEKLQAGLISYHVQKQASLYKDRSGKLVKTVMRPCKWFCHGGVVGCPTPGGKGWASGCQAHREGSCPWVHPDQHEWAEIAMAKMAPADRDVNWRSAKRV
jgi:hypothetical protein